MHSDMVRSQRVDAQTDGGGGYHAITGKRFGACLESALSPTHRIVQPPYFPPPLRG